MITTSFPNSLPQRLLMITLSLFILSPFLMAILAMIIRDIDFTFWFYPLLINDTVWSISFVLVSAAFLILLVNSAKGTKRSSMENPACQGFRAHNKFRLLRPFFLAALWMIISNLVNGWSSIVVPTREESMLTQLGYFLILLPAALCLKDAGKKRLLLRLHLIVSNVLAVAAYVLFFTQTDSAFFTDWTPRLSSIFTNINYYGYYMALTIPLSAAMFVGEKKKSGWRALAAITISVNTLTLVLNDTAGALVGAAAGMLFLIFVYRIREKKWNRDTLVSLGIFLFTLILSRLFTSNLVKNILQILLDLFHILSGSEKAENAGSSRWYIWKESIRLVLAHPVFGIGFEGIERNNLTDIVRNSRPHCEPLQYMLFYGIPAGIFYLAGCVRSFVSLLKPGKADPLCIACLAGAMGYFVSSLFGLTMFAAAPFLFIFLGMGCGSESCE